MTPLLTAEQRARAGSGKLAVHRLYGRTLASDFAFSNRLVCEAGFPDLTFDCVTSGPLPGALEGIEPVYASSPGAENGESSILLYRLEDDCWVVRFRTADFYLWEDHIRCYLPNLEYRYLAEIQLLGVVLACWLERQGIPALHASAVAVGGRAAAFLSTAGGGKSSIAASLMQEGYPLLTDDILAVERVGGVYLGHLGYPQIRMWPEQARRFLGYYEELDIVHPAYSKRRIPAGSDGLGHFCDASQPLACLYLPERRNPTVWGTEIEIKPTSRREGLMALLGQSFIPQIIEATGLQPQRLGFFASLVSQVPVRRIAYPDGYDRLSEVRRAILDDLAALP
jgi:hypothetical protein